MKLCECGCGNSVSKDVRFVQGHHLKSDKYRHVPQKGIKTCMAKNKDDFFIEVINEADADLTVAQIQRRISQKHRRIGVTRHWVTRRLSMHNIEYYLDNRRLKIYKTSVILLKT